MAQGKRRDAILVAARSEFARCGYSGARVERIAAAAGVNKQLIFHYFHSKDGLYTAAVAALFASWQPLPESGAPPSERLRQSISQLVQWLHDNLGAARAIADVGREPAPHEAAHAVPPSEATGWLRDAMNTVRATVESGQGQGYFRDDVDPQAVAEIVTSSALGHALTVDLDGQTSPADTPSIAVNLSRALVEYCAWR